MRDRLRSRLAAFRYAFQGLGHLWRTQPNARIHALATVLVVALAWWLRIDAARGALLSLVIGLVWMAEAFNTALEAAVDLCSPQPHPLAKVARMWALRLCSWPSSPLWPWACSSWACLCWPASVGVAAAKPGQQTKESP